MDALICTCNSLLHVIYKPAAVVALPMLPVALRRVRFLVPQANTSWSALKHRTFATIEELQDQVRIGSSTQTLVYNPRTQIDSINDKFVEARDEIEYAQEVCRVLATSGATPTTGRRDHLL